MESHYTRDERPLTAPPAYKDLIPPAYKDLPKAESGIRGGVTETADRGNVVCVTVEPVCHPDDQRLVTDGSTFDLTEERTNSVDEEEPYWMGSSFSDKKIRRSFIRKVFLILMCQLAVTIGAICLFIFCEPVKNWIHTPGRVWFYWAAYGTFLVTYISLVCCRSLRRQWPWNFICLALFTVSLSWMAGTISSYHDTRIVLIAFGMTTAVCLSLAVFSIQTKIDVTLCSSMLFSVFMVIVLFGIFCIITGPVLGYGSYYIMTGVWGGLLALLFSLFLVFDIQMVIGGKSVQLNPEEYIYGALHIYLDVVYLFLLILSCSSRS